MKRRAIELSDLPPHVRAQAAAQLGTKLAPIGNIRGPVHHGRDSTPRGMNKLEAAYSSYLDARVRNQEILRWRFEPMKLRIGLGAYYKPDFMVTLRNEFGNPIVELHETKGFWREAARVRIKVAADLFPEFFFVAVQRKGGAWVEERF